MVRTLGEPGKVQEPSGTMRTAVEDEAPEKAGNEMEDIPLAAR